MRRFLVTLEVVNEKLNQDKLHKQIAALLTETLQTITIKELIQVGSIKWEMYGNEIVCCLCNARLPNTWDNMCAHHERTLTHQGVKITPCDSNRIASDGP